MTGDLDARLEQVAALGDPLRRSLYRFVAAEPEPVTREQAATGVGVAQHTARFHLDHLVDDGLLEADYRRPAGKGGPGAGRPAKVYRRSQADLDVTLPERRYQLAGELLVRATARAEQTRSPVDEALRAVAEEAGRAAGAHHLAAMDRRPPADAVPEAADALVVEALVADGYEPRCDGDGIALANCPFHALVREGIELVCGMNLAYIGGVLDGLGAPPFDPVLDPTEGRCCVRLEQR